MTLTSPQCITIFFPGKGEVCFPAIRHSTGTLLLRRTDSTAATSLFQEMTVAFMQNLCVWVFLECSLPELFLTLEQYSYFIFPMIGNMFKAHYASFVNNYKKVLNTFLSFPSYSLLWGTPLVEATFSTKSTSPFYEQCPVVRQPCVH